jgi:hypothetical protein
MFRRGGIAVAVGALLVSAACSAPEASVRPPVSLPPRTNPLSASLAGGPQVVTGSRPVSWQVGSDTDDDPLSHGPGPAAATVDLPPTGCSASNSGVPAGEGILTLTLAAPGTSWSNETNTSLVVYATVDEHPPQAIVLFNGAEPFSYQGFVGGLADGAHCVTIALKPDLSHDAMPSPAVEVYGVRVSVVPQTNPAYLLESHAPVMYGRSVSARGDTPLITYGQSQPDADRVDVDLSYTIVWTHEDLGDGLVPPFQWGRWGRMSDIETAVHEKVAPDGKVLSASYLSCGCESFATYPDSSPERSAGGGETYKAYPTSGTAPGLEEHIGIRDATANNDISPRGTTPFRFQESLVAAPSSGESREVAMDEHPWTYRVSGEEVSRENTASSDPRSLLAGVYPQYLIVDISAEATGTSSIAIEVQLAGDPTWYSNDYAQSTAPSPPTTYAFYNGGHARTAIKLPAGWNGKPITALRLRLNAPSGTTPALLGPPAIRLVEITPSFSVEYPAFPAPVVTTAVQNPPQ